jgi:arylsulfatase A-like enzyme
VGGGTDDRAVIDYLRAMPASDGHPNMFFIWLMSAHAAGVLFQDPGPFQPTPSFTRATWFMERGLHSYSPEVRQEIVNQYDNGVAQADSVIAQVFSVLENKGYLTDGVVFITGDHGEGLGERGLYAHGKYIYGEFIRVPLLIYDESATTYKNLSFASLIDIAPTVLDLLGLPKPATWEGLSLLSGPPRTVAFTQNDYIREEPCRGVNARLDGFAPYLIQCERAGGTRTEEVFDMTEDPLGLQAPLTPLAPALLANLRGQLDKEFPVRKNQFR